MDFNNMKTYFMKNPEVGQLQSWSIQEPRFFPSLPSAFSRCCFVLRSRFPAGLHRWLLYFQMSFPDTATSSKRKSVSAQTSRFQEQRNLFASPFISHPKLTHIPNHAQPQARGVIPEEVGRSKNVKKFRAPTAERAGGSHGIGNYDKDSYLLPSTYFPFLPELGSLPFKIKTTLVSLTFSQVTMPLNFGH